MADNRSFQEFLLEQKQTNRQLSSLKTDNKLVSDLLEDIKQDAFKDSSNQGLIKAALPEILSDTVNSRAQTNTQVEEFNQQQKIFEDIAGGIQEMTSVLKAGNKQDADFDADEDAQQERAEALREGGDGEPLPAEGEGTSFLKDLKGSIGGVFAGLKGIFFGTAGIFAAIYLFIAALGNEGFRNVVFKAVDAVKGMFADFDALVNGEMGLLEFLKENALTIAAITALLMPVKTFGVLLKAVKYLPMALGFLKTAFLAIKGVMLGSIMPVLAPIILVVGAVSTVLFGIKGAIEDALTKFKETGSVLDAINFGISSFLGFMITLPAKIFTTLIDGALGLIEFFTFGWLNFDEIQEKIRNLDFAGTMRDAIYDFFQLAQNFIKNTVLNGVQFVLDLGIKLGNFASEMLDGVVGFVKDIGKKIYNPETGEVLGMNLPELPTLGDMTKILSDFAKKIYNPETGEIFGFKLPSLSDLNPFKNFDFKFGFGDKDKELSLSEQIANLDGPTSISDSGVLDLFGIDKDAPKEVQIKTLDEFLNEPTAKEQYKEMMKKMNELQDRLYDEAGTVQQINVIKGGDSVSQSSSTGFSTKKSAQNDDYTVQALAGSYP
jgi:hypothetical protein